MVIRAREDSLLDASCLMKGFEPCCAVAEAILLVCVVLSMVDLRGSRENSLACPEI